jgi:hypothetical protein
MTGVHHGKLNWDRRGREYIARESGELGARLFLVAPTATPGRYFLWVDGAMVCEGRKFDMFRKAEEMIR